MTITVISAAEANQKLQQGAVLVDIREVDEHRREHIQCAVLQPLSQLKASGLSAEQVCQAQEVIFHCKSGMRTQGAAELLMQLAPNQQLFIVEQGLEGWKSAGLATTVDSSQPLELMRQVQIVAGSLVLLGVILGYLATPAFYFLSAFVGAGLVFAGVTGFCGMTRLLAKMPWNRPR